MKIRDTSVVSTRAQLQRVGHQVQESDTTKGASWAQSSKMGAAEAGPSTQSWEKNQRQLFGKTQILLR